VTALSLVCTIWLNSYPPETINHSSTVTFQLNTSHIIFKTNVFEKRTGNSIPLTPSVYSLVVP